MTTARTRVARASLLLLAVTIVTAACQPRLSVPVATIPSPAGATLSVDAATLVRGSTVVATATGCADDFQYAEIRLVVGVGDERQSVAVTTGGAEPVDLDVPVWTPVGPAAVEASCLEPNFSGASDGAEVLVFDFAPAAVTVAAAPAAQPAPLLDAPSVVTDGVLRVGGSGCAGSVLVAVTRGPWRVASAARYHYSRTIVTPEADGSWAAAIPLVYRVGSFSDPVAPGPMTAFAVCDGQWFPAHSFWVRDTGPAVQTLGDASTLYLSQCPPENDLLVLGRVTLAGGGEEEVWHTSPGPGYGESFTWVPLPPGATEVTWHAACGGALLPNFLYQPLTVAVT